MKKNDYIDAEAEIVNEKEKESSWKKIKDNFKESWEKTKNGFKKTYEDAKSVITNLDATDAFTNQTTEFKILNPKDIYVVGNTVYGILNEENNSILFKKSTTILTRIHVGTILQQVNTQNKFEITEIDEKIEKYNVTVEQEEKSVECYRTTIKKY